MLSTRMYTRFETLPLFNKSLSVIPKVTFVLLKYGYNQYRMSFVILRDIYEIYMKKSFILHKTI